ncbi:unnamed protein product [Menidia menidia]|uniref:(Atlantic silverside) hypothetical protein n=1 Tax=Menidia menidia TaxID=238744 RepID=A0A8S4AV67_9TELE|nr:unnamed protein product [Menidia menidia]
MADSLAAEGECKLLLRAKHPLVFLELEPGRLTYQELKFVQNRRPKRIYREKHVPGSFFKGGRDIHLTSFEWIALSGAECTLTFRGMLILIFAT